MANQPTTKPKTNKGPIIGTCIAIIAIIVIIIVAVVVINNNKPLGDDYFVSDGTKYVINLSTDEIGTENTDKFAPVKTHIVYTYSGDDITGVKNYYEYSNETDAKAAQEYLSTANTEGFESVTIDGRYVIITSAKSEYENLKASDVKQQIELIERYRNTNTSTDDSNTTD